MALTLKASQVSVIHSVMDAYSEQAEEILKPEDCL